MLLRMLGNRAFVAMPNIPQHVDGMSSKLVISLLANESSRGQLLERLPLGQRQRLNERALASMACESAFSEGSNCGRKPGPDVMDPQIARIAWVHEESYKLPEVRGYALPECSVKSVRYIIAATKRAPKAPGGTAVMLSGKRRGGKRRAKQPHLGRGSGP